MLKGPWRQNTSLFCLKDLVLYSALSACPTATLYSMWNLTVSAKISNLPLHHVFCNAMNGISRVGIWNKNGMLTKAANHGKKIFFCQPGYCAFTDCELYCSRTPVCTRFLFVCFDRTCTWAAIATADSNCVMKYWISLDSKGHVDGSVTYTS